MKCNYLALIIVILNTANVVHCQGNITHISPVAMDGDNIIINCTFSTLDYVQADLDIEWLYPGLNSTADSRIESGRFDGKTSTMFFLKINNASRSTDAGDYVCKLSNFEGPIAEKIMRLKFAEEVQVQVQSNRRPAEQTRETKINLFWIIIGVKIVAIFVLAFGAGMYCRSKRKRQGLETIEI